MPIAGQPLVARIIRWLVRQQVRDLILNLHALPETITRCVGDGSDLGARVRYSWEVPILGSAGGPRKMLALTDDETVFLINGDTMIDVDLPAMAAAHEASGALATLAVVEHKWPGRYGGVVTDSRGIVHGFVPKGPAAIGYHFVSVQIVHRSVFDRVQIGEAAESFSGVYKQLIAERPGSVRAFLVDAPFIDVGTAADYFDACMTIGRTEHAPDVQIGLRTSIDPSAKVTASILWDDVIVERDAAIDRCIIADGVRISAGSRFDNCAIIEQDGKLITKAIER